MEKISGTNLAAGIAPFTTDDKYATHYAEYGKGGWHSVATISDRDAIPVQRRETGMVVFVQEENIPYRLAADGSWERLLNEVDDSLSSTSTNPIQNRAVYEEITKVNTSLSTKQDKTDNSLNTYEKTIVGAINEVTQIRKREYSINFYGVNGTALEHNLSGHTLTIGKIVSTNVRALSYSIQDGVQNQSITLVNGQWVAGGTPESIVIPDGAQIAWKAARIDDSEIAEITIKEALNYGYKTT